MTASGTAAGRLEPLPLTVHVVVYLAIGWVGLQIFAAVTPWVAGYFLGAAATSLCTALLVNFLTLRIYTGRRMADLGLWWNRASVDNLAFGVLGGVGAASAVLAPPLLLGAAHISATPAELPSFGAAILATVGLVGGAVGEEFLFRGYAFQILMASCGEWATVIPVGAVFALMHWPNPSASWFSVANTAGFGILFGYAYLRSRDLWLPIGLHFGWNFTLPLFGVNVSGLRMKMTGHEMVWSAGKLWSGGDYGPEASVLTTAVMVALAFYLWKAPIRRQNSPLTDPREGSDVCEPSPALPL